VTARHRDRLAVVYVRQSTPQQVLEHGESTRLQYGLTTRAVELGWAPSLHRRTGSSAADLAQMINPVVRGWMNYYGSFYRTALHPVLYRINTYLLRWIMKKYRKLRTWKKAFQSMRDAATSHPRYFAHWVWVKPAIR
jgi:hypothetical protein